MDAEVVFKELPKTACNIQFLYFCFKNTEIMKLLKKYIDKRQTRIKIANDIHG